MKLRDAKVVLCGGIRTPIGHFSKMGFVYYLLGLAITSMTGWNTYAVIVGVGVVSMSLAFAALRGRVRRG